MKPVVPVTVLAFGLALAACTPLTLYYRDGAEVGRMQTEQTSCEIKALRDVPPSTQIRREPPYYLPGRRECNSDGDCRTRGGYWIPGEIYSVDVNANLRERAEVLCMAEKGYRKITIPDCKPGISRSVAPGQTRTLPPLTPTTCAVRGSGGSWQIVNTAG